MGTRGVWLVATVLVVAFATPALAQDVTGTWTAYVELDVGSGEPTFVFRQEGNRITGTYEGTFGSADLEGTVAGEKIEFSFAAEGVGRATYMGTISGNTMKGTCDYGQLGGGTWEAEKQ